jgi:hypothetical protein
VTKLIVFVFRTASDVVHRFCLLPHHYFVVSAKLALSKRQQVPTLETKKCIILVVQVHIFDFS